MKTAGQVLVLMPRRLPAEVKDTQLATYASIYSIEFTGTRLLVTCKLPKENGTGICGNRTRIGHEGKLESPTP